MNLVRQHFLAKTFALITGVLFLNMSFFALEVSMLKIANKQLAENVAKLISNSGFEEEKGGESSGNDSTAKEVDVLLNQLQIHQHSLYLLSVKINRTVDDHYLHANYALTFSPPPDCDLIS